MILNVGQDIDNYRIIDIAKLVKLNVPNSSIEHIDPDSNNPLVVDKKIQDGVDTRSYKVRFDKIHKILPGFKCKWNVEQGIFNLLDDLKKINLSKDVFNTREFYRLQQIEFLHKKKKIDDNLFWVQ